jgi:hypothetical protein
MKPHEPKNRDKIKVKKNGKTKGDKKNQTEIRGKGNKTISHKK